MPTVSNILREQGVRTGALSEYLASRLRIFVYEVVFGASENYPAGGAPVTFPGISTVIAAVYVGGDLDNYRVVYDLGNGRIRIFGQEPASTSSGVVAFSEIPANSTITNNRRLRFLVIGR
ncbi:MAG: hypothetical protein NZ941_03210 [Candidatus Caldarchaeum sp.]|nr:hypothetical protein [Candidatus Caldarchaeum sp.]